MPSASFSVLLASAPTPVPSSLIIILNYGEHELIELFSLFIFTKMCPANEKRSQDKRESLENGHEVLSSMFSEMQQAKVLYNTLESVGEVKESSDVILQHLKESSEKISDGMRTHEENMKKIESAVEAQNQRIEELHKALNQILNIVKEKAEKEP